MDLGNMRPKGHFWKVPTFENYGKLRPEENCYLRKLPSIIFWL